MNSNLQSSSKAILPHSVASPKKIQPQAAPRRSNAVIRVALVDVDESVHQVFCQAAEILAEGWVIESFYSTGAATRNIFKSPPHVILMAIRMPEMGGIECCRRIKAALPLLPVIMHTACADFGSVLLACQAGANGYLIKPVPPREMVHAINAVLKGFTPLCLKAQQLFVQAFHQSASTEGLRELLLPRELEVITQLLQNKSDKKISQALNIGLATVHTHLMNIFRKLHVHDRHAACRKFFNLS